MRTAFYTKKNIIYMLVGGIIFYLTLALAPFYYYEYAANRKREATEQLFTTEQAKLTEEQKATQRAEAYLLQNFTTIKLPQRLFLDYLQRKFDTNEKFSVTKSPLEFSEEAPNFPRETDLLARIAYPDFIVDQLPSSENAAVTYTNIYGANCDHIPVPQNFWSLVDSQVKSGGYDLTHIVLMLAMMKDNGCQMPSNIDEINGALTEGLVKIIENPDTARDLRYEAMAFLMLAGKHALVEPKWIEQLISEQNGNGSWSDKGDYANIDHTTFLAYWALLEYQHSNQPYEPIIRRPSHQP